MNLNIKKRKNIVMNISELNDNYTTQREKEKKINEQADDCNGLRGISSVLLP